MNVDIRDEQFKSNPNAIFVCGNYAEPFMSQFPGCGYSATPYAMKALLIDGIVWIPDPRYIRNTPKRERDYSNYPMVVARVQPPSYAIKGAA
ncbi:MAG: hypothetical protein GY841_10190 [FCB group bacterium]|nr:hypothetical protein [FCB group bacterium]